MHIVRPAAFRSCSRSLLVLFTTTLLLAGTVRAQSATPSDSAPFRPGQFGVEFGLGGSFASVGLLRFSTPQRALLFDLQGQVRTSSGTNSVQRIDPDVRIALPRGEDFYQLAARFGVRRYHPVTAQVQRFLTLGVLGQAARLVTDFTQPVETTTVGGGGFLELGAAWMVTPNLSLGASWGADAVYSRSSSTVEGIGLGQTPITANRSEFAFSAGRIGVRGNLYF